MSLNNRDWYQTTNYTPSTTCIPLQPKAFAEQSEVSQLIERVDKLLTYLEEPVSIILTGKRAMDEYERLFKK